MRRGTQVGIGTLALGLFAIAGAAADVDEALVVVEASRVRVASTAHIYFNMLTGERVVTLEDDGSRDAASEREVVWSSSVRNTCSDAGYSSEYFYELDSSCSGTSCQGWGIGDFGDIRHDQVIDCVRVNWYTYFDDTDSDFDGVGDGVPGFGAVWTYWEADNGRVENQEDRALALELMIESLPGNIADGGQATVYTMDIDLISGIGSSDLSFELGDTDGDLNGAAMHRPLYGVTHPDLDGDGLFDWGWSIRFLSYYDFDGDGEPDGFPNGRRENGVAIGSPSGQSINNADGTWSWEIDTTVEGAGTGQEDLFTVYDSLGGYRGSGWFGGYSCEDNGIGGYTPPAMFAHTLYGPAGAGRCLADLNGDSVVNFFDVSEFLRGFGLGEDYNGDGETNFFDVSSFLVDYSAGCP